MALVVRLFGAVCALVSLLHMTLGMRADLMLGTSLPAAVFTNPSLDSQNRFYGAAFMLFGFVSWTCARNLRNHANLFRALMFVFFVGGLTRVVSAILHGQPVFAIQCLTATELLILPLMIFWHSRYLRANVRSGTAKENNR